MGVVEVASEVCESTRFRVEPVQPRAVMTHPEDPVRVAVDRVDRVGERGVGVVWWDMNLGRQLRDHLLELFAEYDARVRIVHVEADREQVLDHLGGLGMGETDLDFLLERWEVPDATEAHELQLISAARAAETVQV